MKVALSKVTVLSSGDDTLAPYTYTTWPPQQLTRHVVVTGNVLHSSGVGTDLQNIPIQYNAKKTDVIISKV